MRIKFPLGEFRRYYRYVFLPSIFILSSLLPVALSGQLGVTFTDMVDPGCNGLPNGSARAVASGGAGPYDYNWSNGTEGAILSNVSAGTFTVTVVDNDGATASSTLTLTDPEFLLLEFSVQQCELPLTIMAVGSGGVPPYTYKWSSGQGTFNITANPGVEYCVTITDKNNCAAVDCMTLEFEPLDLQVAANGITCPGENDGTITANPSGGNSPLQYAWSNGATSQTLTGLAPGNYTVTVTDSKGCIASATGTVGSKNPIEIELTSMDPSCSGETDGSVLSQVSGGLPPYSYSWSNGANSSSIASLGPGNYGLTVTDANGCTVEKSITLESQSALSVTVAPTDESCPEATDGTLTVTVTNGNEPYTYSWSNGGNARILTGVAPGTYSVTVTDAAGCQDEGSATIDPASGFEIEMGSTDTDACGAVSGSASVTVISGAGPYTYAWNNGATTAEINNLNAGNYAVTVTGANGCTLSGEVQVVEPAAISAILISTDLLCIGDETGAIDLSVSGGIPPYAFAWSNGETSEDVFGLVAGTYSVTITDDTGCSVEQSSSIADPSPVSITGIADAVHCNGGSDGALDISVAGGTPPYFFNWNHGSTAEDPGNLEAGIYSVTVTDANGCGGEATFTVGEPVALNLGATLSDVSCTGGNDGFINITVDGGAAPYSFNWSNGVATEDLTDIPAGSYSVTVTDANNCTISATGTVSEPQPLLCEITKLTDVGQGNDGSLKAEVTGGTPPYSYSWSSGQTADQIDGLSAGTFGLTVTDANNCITSCTIELGDLAALGDYVWEDISKDGFQDDNEPPITGLEVLLKNEQGIVLESTVTDNAGFYRFTGLQQGTYSVQFVGPEGYKATILNAGSDDALDSDADAEMEGMTATVTLAPGEFNPTIDAGFYLPPEGAITDPCQCLDNATNEENGQFSEQILVRSYPGETWTIIEQTNMYLLESPPPPLAPLPVPVGAEIEESAAAGEYVLDFKLVDELSYTILATNGFDTLSFTNTCAYPTINVEEMPPAEACFGDEAIVLSAAPSVPGTVTFYLNGVEITEFDPSALEVGTYGLLVEFVPDDPEECIATFLSDIAIKDECFAAIGDLVWEDKDKDGIQDEGESGINGVNVTLNGVGGSAPYSKMTTTDETGLYMFQVPPGTYKVIFGRPENYAPVTANSGADDALDSDMDPLSFMTQEVTVGPGEQNLTLDAGFIRECINVYDPGFPGAEILGPSTICEEVVESYEAGGVSEQAEVSWDFGPGAQPRTATGPIAHVQFSSFGTFTIEVTVSENDCTWVATKRVVVTNNPAICGEGLIINAEVIDQATGDVMVHWEVDKAVQMTYMVEHSVDSTNFTELGPNDDPSGSNADKWQYEFPTQAIKKGRNFYRVTMTDANGQKWPSNIADVILFNGSKLALLYPNPATDVAILEVFESFNEDVFVELVTITGQQLNSWEVAAGTERIEMDLKTFASGTYLLRIRFGDTNVKALKLVKY